MAANLQAPSPLATLWSTQSERRYDILVRSRGKDATEVSVILKPRPPSDAVETIGHLGVILRCEHLHWAEAHLPSLRVCQEALGEDVSPWQIAHDLGQMARALGKTGVDVDWRSENGSGDLERVSIIAARQPGEGDAWVQEITLPRLPPGTVDDNPTENNERYCRVDTA